MNEPSQCSFYHVERQHMQAAGTEHELAPVVPFEDPADALNELDPDRMLGCSIMGN